ncbi:TauD/TfdA dioxygenase family protein [Hyphomonas johnsonii]|uniref:TauD/TfdA dioxygenase family protein n=1 Tax=Hyphomonas johnsonii TaxID=81031 RepID=UPI00055940B3|nr:TauD/TfdA family dioxygenase [Hyphomonas johnsonii]
MTAIQITPLSGTLGAEITGLDLSGELSNAAFDQIHSAFMAHKVLVFRGQHTLTPDQHKAFGRRFGTLNVHPYVEAMPGHPEILEIIKEPEDTVNFGGGWHTDMSFLEEPALGSILHAIETPPYGGDTLFADQQAAYDALSDGLKKTLSGMTAIHSAGKEYGAKGISAKDRKSMQATRADDAPEYEHPVIRTHPETGRKGLYVNPAFTLRFAGWTRAESKPLLNYLFDLSRQEQFTCRVRWQAGDVTMWDNRCTWHFALNDYAGQRRHMRRVTVNGDRPR